MFPIVSLLSALSLLVAPCLARPFLPPVRAPLVDGFRLPYGPYGAGNRGNEYATTPGQSVYAIAAGEVSFAGVIAGERYVSIRHAGGLVSSYSYLATIALHPGASVPRAAVVGTATDRLQLGLRRDGEYIDPAPLLSPDGRIRLVPNDRPGPSRRCDVREREFALRAPRDS